MTPENVQSVITWIIGSVLLSIVSLIAGIFSVYRSGKILPKEERGMDLDNKIKEAELLDKYKELLNKELETNKDLQQRLDKVEAAQDILDGKIEMQEEDIKRLRCELDNARLYNKALIEQMIRNKIVPIKMKDLPLKDCGDTTLTDNTDLDIIKQGLKENV
jgi:hypothetical protein